MTPDMMVIGQQLALRNIRSILEDLCKEYPELQGDGEFCVPTDANPTSLLTSPGRFPQEISRARIFGAICSQFDGGAAGGDWHSQTNLYRRTG